MNITIPMVYGRILLQLLRTDKGDYYFVNEIAAILFVEEEQLRKGLPKSACIGRGSNLAVKDKYIPKLLKKIPTVESKQFSDWIEHQLSLK